MGNWIGSVIKKAAGKGGVAGAAATVGLTLATSILGKEGARANLEFLVASILPGEIEPGHIPDEARASADAIASHLGSSGLDPERIAVDGVPGSGKSTLAAALAGRLGMDVVCLDHQNLDRPLTFDRTRAIYEHHRLLRTQDIESFDVIVHIDEPVAISREKALRRRRGAYLVDVMDYDRLKRIGKKAFSIADGQRIAVDGSLIEAKIRPPTGFNARQNLARELDGRGLNGAGLSKEQALFLCVEGNARQGLRAQGLRRPPCV